MAPNTSIDDVHITSSQIQKAQNEADEIFKIFKSKKGEMYRTFEDFKENGLFDIRGKKVSFKNGTITEEGWKELYAAASIYRSKTFETMRYIFVDPLHRIRDQVAITSYMPDTCIMNLAGSTDKEIITHAENNNLYVIACHNHPSGNTSPSDLDILSTNALLKNMTNVNGDTRFLGHIILDHDSFSYFNPRNGWHNYSDENKKISFQEYRLTDNKITEFGSLEYFSHSSFFKDVVQEVNEKNNYSDNYIPVVYCDSDRKLKSFRYYNKKLFNENKDFAKKVLINDARENGATYIFPVITENNIKKIKNTDKLQENIIELIKNNVITDCSFSGKSLCSFYHINGGCISSNFDADNNIKIRSTFKRYIDKSIFKDSDKNNNEKKSISVLLEQKEFLENTRKVFEDTYTLIRESNNSSDIEKKLSDGLTPEQKQMILKAAENFNIHVDKTDTRNKGRTA